MTEPTDLLEHAMKLIAEPETGVAEVHRDLARRQRNRKLAAGAVVVGIWLVIGVAAVALGSSDDTVPAQTPSPTVDPATRAYGWPGGDRNPAGDYSWNTFPGGNRWMHNAYPPGSGDVNITIEGEEGRLIPHRGGTRVTVFGYEGTYRRFTYNFPNARHSDEWMVDIQGTTVTITLTEEPKARETELAEAREIIESIRVAPDADDGDGDRVDFRLIFTLTTNTWDSG